MQHEQVLVLVRVLAVCTLKSNHASHLAARGVEWRIEMG